MLVNVQFLRFAAALLVVLYHTAAQVGGSDHPALWLFSLGQTVGFAGVDVFFVISGFIMAHTTMVREGHRDASQFARRRLARIYAGHWPFFVLTFLVFAWARPAHWQESHWLASFFLWPLPLNQTLLEITWTLSFELYFYALFTALVWLVPRDRRLVCCVLVSAVLLAVTVYRHWISNSFDADHLYFMPFAVHFLASPFLLEFFAGALLAYLLRYDSQKGGWYWLLAGIGLFLAAGAINEWLFGGHLEQGFHVVPRVLLFGSAAVLMVTGLVRLEADEIRAPVRFSLLAGGASYAIYLSHIPVLESARQLGLSAWLAALAPFWALLGFGLLVALIVVLSMVHYRGLELPLHQLFKRLLRVSKRN